MLKEKRPIRKRAANQIKFLGEHVLYFTVTWGVVPKSWLVTLKKRFVMIEHVLIKNQVKHSEFLFVLLLTILGTPFRTNENYWYCASRTCCTWLRPWWFFIRRETTCSSDRLVACNVKKRGTNHKLNILYSLMFSLFGPSPCEPVCLVWELLPFELNK